MRWPSLSASGGSSFFQSWGREGEGREERGKRRGGEGGRGGEERMTRRREGEEGEERSGINVRVTVMYVCNGRKCGQCPCCVGVLSGELVCTHTHWLHL